MAAKASVNSPTGAMRDVFESRTDELEDYLKAIELKPGQKGLAVSINGSVVGVDVVRVRTAPCEAGKELRHRGDARGEEEWRVPRFRKDALLDSFVREVGLPFSRKIRELSQLRGKQKMPSSAETMLQQVKALTESGFFSDSHRNKILQKVANLRNARVLSADPTRKIAENEIVVDFEMRLPWPLANSKYSTGNILTRLDNNEYEVCWCLVASDSLIDSKGTEQFIPYGKMTLLKYQSFIHPGSKLASVLSSKVRGGITKTVRAIVTYIEETKKSNPEKIQKLISTLLK